ncbi:MAG TPA: hypothetical protein VMR70_16465 [Flavisolibacter sp.]|nr:hypothetical protein [Flavisolibacter sp.]
MRLFSFLGKKEKAPCPLWSKEIHGETLHYHGEDIPTFLKEFDRLEDRIIGLWEINQLSWVDYQRLVAEVQEAKSLFVRFAY